MTVPEPENVTELLIAWAQGDEETRDELIPLVYDTLRSIARRRLGGERAGHTLETTELINEAYLKLVEQSVSWQNRARFFGIAARLMRLFLVDYARAPGRGSNAAETAADFALGRHPDRAVTGRGPARP